jgi:hypothetical protein
LESSRLIRKLKAKRIGRNSILLAFFVFAGAPKAQLKALLKKQSISYRLLPQIVQSNMLLIERGGGTGPVKPGNRYDKSTAVPIPTMETLKDERRITLSLSSFKAREDFTFIKMSDRITKYYLKRGNQHE